MSSSVFNNGGWKGRTASFFSSFLLSAIVAVVCIILLSTVVMVLVVAVVALVVVVMLSFFLDILLILLVLLSPLYLKQIVKIESRYTPIQTEPIRKNIHINKTYCTNCEDNRILINITFYNRMSGKYKIHYRHY
jgi:hypothetical protein